MVPYAPTHHILDITPVPTSVTYVNEPSLIDITAPASDDKPDNIRIYVPMDINKDAILRRLSDLVGKYKQANDGNESDFSCEVGQLVSQIEIYDQIWTVREMKQSVINSKGRRHSLRTRELVTAFVKALEEIPDGCAECFPFEMIDNLRGEYLE